MKNPNNISLGNINGILQFNRAIFILQFLLCIMSLKTYKQKRNFKKTIEPEGRIKKIKTKKPIFVIHFHKARTDHYDFRLEINGVLKSWAIPKEPSKTKGVKRLSIQVEDHPLDYASFEGTIPEGNYGAGEVKIWDKGSYVLESKKENKIVFELHGKKLKGKYVLVKTKYGNKPKKSWLFFKI